MRRTIYVLALLVVCSLAGAQDARREWPASERDLVALRAIEARRAELDAAQKRLNEEVAALRRSLEAVTAEIRSSCVGLDPKEDLRFDAAKKVFYVEAAAVSTGSK